MTDQFNVQIQQIKRLPLFNCLDENDIGEMLMHGDIIKVLRYAKGERIIIENRLTRKIYLTLQGSVKIMKEVICEKCKDNKLIKIINGEGHFLGEISAFTGTPSTATVIAIQPTTCIMIDIERLNDASSKLLERIKTSFYPVLFNLLCKRLGDTDEALVYSKKKCEDLEMKLNELRLEKLNLQKKYNKEILKKNRIIKTLEDFITNRNPL